MAGDVRDARLFDRDPLTGVVELFHYDPDTDGFSIETVEDVEPLLELNYERWKLKDTHAKYGEMAHVASIPSVLVMQLAQQGILSYAGAILDEPRFRKWLNDSDNRAFRTRPGRV